MSSISVAKHRYIKAGPKAKAAAKAHVNYIQHRSGQDKDQGQARDFFDKDGDHLPGSNVKRDIDAASDRGVIIHKLILSPGVKGVDLQQYTRELMEEIGERKGLDLKWSGVAHGNTEHDHVHVIVMGRDANGRIVLFNRDDYQQLRDIGDRYLERRHEFDRYFDRSMDNLLKEGGDRPFDLDKLFQPSQPFLEKTANKTKKKRKAKPDRELHEKPEYTKSRYQRKPRKQRALETKGRQDRDYFHDLYERQTTRRRLEKQVESTAERDPQKSHYYQEQLAFMDKIDADRRADIMARSVELDRILGLSPTQAKQKSPTASTASAAQDTSIKETEQLKEDTRELQPDVIEEPNVEETRIIDQVPDRELHEPHLSAIEEERKDTDREDQELEKAPADDAKEQTDRDQDEQFNRRSREEEQRQEEEKTREEQDRDGQDR